MRRKGIADDNAASIPSTRNPTVIFTISGALSILSKGENISCSSWNASLIGIHKQEPTKWSTRVALSVEKRKWSVFAEREPLLSVMIKLPVIEFTGPPNISSLWTERRQKGLSNLYVSAKQFSWLPSWQESDPWCVNFFCERSLTSCEVFWPAGNAKWSLRVDCGWVYSQHCSQFGTIEPNRERIYWWPTDGWVKKQSMYLDEMVVKKPPRLFPWQVLICGWVVWALPDGYFLAQPGPREKKQWWKWW